MSRLGLIIQREYMQIVAKKSFIFTTILLPILPEEARGVAAFRHFLVAFLYEVLQFGEECYRVQVVALAPTRVGAEVADGAVGMSLNEKGVVVAVFFHADQMQEVA